MSLRWAMRGLRPLLPRRSFCTLSDTSRESELFWNSKDKSSTDKRVPRKVSEIPNYASKFEEMTEDERAEEMAAAESRLHKKPKMKDDREVWNALSKARKYQMTKGKSARK
mmetsp:Transcript_40548/g.78939  ORF Transcript_40548/g.78939 Transcript_40548/m.78939 type:complete len:111 (-) Transcript_40548:502-834(-)